MKFIFVLSFLAFTSVTLSYPINTRSQVTSLDFSGDADFSDIKTVAASPDLSNSTISASNTTLDLSDVKTDATSKSSGLSTMKAPTGQSSNARAPSGQTTTAKDSTSGGAAKATSGSSSKKPSMATVQQATTNFAKDANTVSASLNQLPDETSANSIKSLATTAFNAESDEDAQRAVLAVAAAAAAAGSAGSSSNTKIVQNTPTVLEGLKAIMQKPTAVMVKSNVATIQNSR